MDANVSKAVKRHPAPWKGEAEPAPIGDTGDADAPFVIRDADGDIVLTLWEEYGPNLTPLHEILGKRIIATINEAAILENFARDPKVSAEAIGLRVVNNLGR